jgi:hypothetical protein
MASMVALSNFPAATMRSDDITPAQAERIKVKIRPMLGYLGRLKHRMHKRRFPHDDLLFRTVLNAYDAIHELNVHVHYLSCSSGVGRAPPKTEYRERPE